MSQYQDDAYLQKPLLHDAPPHYDVPTSPGHDPALLNLYPQLNQPSTPHSTPHSPTYTQSSVPYVDPYAGVQPIKRLSTTTSLPHHHQQHLDVEKNPSSPRYADIHQDQPIVTPHSPNHHLSPNHQFQQHQQLPSQYQQHPQQHPQQQPRQSQHQLSTPSQSSQFQLYPTIPQHIRTESPSSANIAPKTTTPTTPTTTTTATNTRQATPLQSPSQQTQQTQQTIYQQQQAHQEPSSQLNQQRQPEQMVHNEEIQYQLKKPKPVPGVKQLQQQFNLKQLQDQESNRQQRPTNVQISPEQQRQYEQQRQQDMLQQSQPRAYAPNPQPAARAVCGNCREQYNIPPGADSWRCKKCGKFQNMGSNECSVM